MREIDLGYQVRLGPGGSAYGGSLSRLIISQSNPSRRGFYTRGSGFYTTRTYEQFSPVPLYLKKGTNSVDTLVVPITVRKAPWDIHGNLTAPSWSVAEAAAWTKGATGWKRARPGNPMASLGQWVVELHQLPRAPGRELLRLGRPSAILSAKGFAKAMSALGKEYLNGIFGWRPFVEDLRKAVELQQVLEQRLSDLYRMQTNGVRRRRDIDEKTTSTTTTQGVIGQPFAGFWSGDLNGLSIGGALSGARASHRITTVDYQKSWFVGKYRYYMPPPPSPSSWSIRQKAALFGALPTPSLLYEVMPWTWLAGWFTNFGDVVSNMSSNAVSNLVAEYAFVMTHTKHDVTVETTCTWPDQVGWNSPGDTPKGRTITTTHSSGWESKLRTYGSPYGFGVNFDALSGYQKSVLAALGISRARF